MLNERQARIEGAEKHIPIMEQGTRGHAISHSICNIVYCGMARLLR